VVPGRHRSAHLKGAHGFLGHTYPGMLDMYSDFTMHQAQLGAHIEVLEMDDLHRGGAARKLRPAKINEIRRCLR
jgi:L-arabinose isomerase